MDNFLHLVPIANDLSLDHGLVYGDDEDEYGGSADTDTSYVLDNLSERHYPPPVLDVTASRDSNDNIGAVANARKRQHDASESTSDIDAARARRAFLARAELLETQMQQIAHATQQRMDAMTRILALPDPHEQLAQYLALQLDERPCEPSINIAADLLECMRQLTNATDNEIALLGAFVVACDASPHTTARRPASLLPVIAAMMIKHVGRR